ncbi:MAG: phage terminase large subunit [Rikenellaceae bacterium]
MITAQEKREIQDRWELRKRQILAIDSAFGENEAEKSRRISRARRDYNYFVKTYFPHITVNHLDEQVPNAKFHLDAANYIKNNPRARAVFEWARGHAKSTHISLMIPLWLLFQERREIDVMVLISKSEASAAGLLSDLQIELESNKLLINDFGNQTGEGSWSEGKFITKDGAMFVALGRGQSPRGLKNQSRRPNYISVDDIDDDEMVDNPRRVKRCVKWLLSAVYGTMAGGRGRYVVVGNNIGKTSVLSEVIKRKTFHHTKVNMLDRNGNPSWSSNYTLEEIEGIRADIGENNFQKEYMNNPITEGSVFKEEHIRYGKMLPIEQYASVLSYTDPSFKDTATADYKASFLMGITKDGYYHILKGCAGRTSVSMMVQWHYDFHSYVGGRRPVRYYIEANMLQDLLLDEFKKQGEERGLHIAITPDKRKKKDKFSRIEATQPLWERGLIIINEVEKDSPGIKILVEQLLAFERGSKANDDAPDAVEGGISLLNKRKGGVEAKQYRRPERNSQKY